MAAPLGLQIFDAIVAVAAALAGGFGGGIIATIFLGDNCNDSGYPNFHTWRGHTLREGTAFCFGAYVGAHLALWLVNSVLGPIPFLLLLLSLWARRRSPYK